MKKKPTYITCSFYIRTCRFLLSTCFSLLLCLSFSFTAHAAYGTGNLNNNSVEQQQKKQVTGKVTDIKGQPLPGVSVLVRGSVIGTVTGENGNYSLQVPADARRLTFSFIGMKSQEVEIGNRTVVDLTMEEDVSTLEEVVVMSTGYQTISKERATGSFSVINPKKIENKLQPTLRSVLEGQVSGVVLAKDGTIEIRGVSTILGTKTPLIVVDGYPLIGNGVDLESINPNNIENITILKDAVAASIYGARASNGVIVINTKKAAKGTYSIGYKGTFGVTLKPDLKKLNISSVSDYMDAELDLYNQDLNAPFTSYSAYSRLSDNTYLMMAKDKALMPAAEADAKIAALKKNNALQQIQDYLIRPRQSQQHNLSISGGNEKSLFNGVVRYVTEKGNLIANDNSRLTVDFTNVWTPKEWITLRFISNINYAITNSTSESYLTLTAFNSTSRITPYTQLYDDAGNPTPWMPVGQRKLSTYSTYPGMKSVNYHPETDLPLNATVNQNLQMRLGGDINLKFFKFLTGSFGGSWIKGAVTNRTVVDGESFNMRTAYNDGTSVTNSTKHYIPEGGKIDESRGTIETWVIRSQLNYNQSFNGNLHRVTAMVGNEVNRDTYETAYLPTRLGYSKISASFNSGFNPYDYNNNTGNIRGDFLFSGLNPSYLGTISYGSNYAVRDNRFVSTYGNASYEYKSKYLLTGSVRLDLTNFFGTDPKYRYRPTWSIGGTWKMAEESYFSGLKSIINRFNLRASYGINGNISLSYTPYLVLSVGSHNTTTGGVSYSISTYPNNQLRWERTQIINLGADISAFKDRINLTVDYYKKRSTDLIASEAIDETRGTTSLPQNVGSLTNKGLEVTLSGDVFNENNFRWNSGIIASYNTSNVDHYNVSRMYFTSYGTAGGLLVQGYPMDGMWGARFAGLDNQGIAMYYSKNGDKVAGGSLKAEDAVYFGTFRPKLDMSWTNSFRYKNYEASFMFIGKFGHKYRKDNFSGSNYINRHVSERWRKPGDEANTIYPKLTSWNMDMFYFPYSDVLIGNANYVKLRDFTFSYYLPKTWVKTAGMTDVKIYFQTRNLFYITAKGVDIDPETAEINSSGGTGAMTNQAYTSLQLRPEFYFGIAINL